jgi:two-component system, sensor histidine kinase and response regulator
LEQDRKDSPATSPAAQSGTSSAPTEEAGGTEPPSSNGEAGGASPAVFDLDAALARVGGDRDVFETMIGFFVEDLPGLLDEIHKGTRDRDAELVGRAAHSLRGLAATFSAPGAVDAAGDLEKRAAAGDLHALPASAERLRHEVMRLQEALESVRGAE